MSILNRMGSFVFLVTLSVVSSVLPVHAQSTPPLDLSAYQEYFLQHADMTAADLLAEYDAGVFSKSAPVDMLSSNFGTEQSAFFGFTPDEVDLVNRNGFAVSERLSYPSFGRAFVDVFVNDLPVYVSSDAILHAIHMSYDSILQDVERNILIPRLEAALTSMHAALPGLAASYASTPELTEMLKDVDVFLTVPMKLLGLHTEPVFDENDAVVSQMLAYVAAEQSAGVAMFAETKRTVDFSQFTPRGHYTDEPALTRYFQAMIWLGRTELYLIAPKNTIPAFTDEDVRRQIIVTKLVEELASTPSAEEAIEDIDRIIRTLVGDSDNVTLANVRSVFDESGVQSADQLLDQTTWKDFQARLAEKPFAFQKILSQILIQDPSGEQIEFASSFLLLGQRFIIDSYVTGYVVFDRIEATRMMPSTLDVLFALGNDGAAQFLEEELDRYGYAANLASLRYLVDSYDDSFWTRSLYNGWLNAIRKLSPPTDRSELPPFMQTAPWWQKQMTTQLASWAQLRHDNLLYAKQSYTTGLGCLFPESLVEPVPAFFEAVGSFASEAAASLDAVLPSDAPLRAEILDYFVRTAVTMDMLRAIAQKEIDGVPFSEQDRQFLGDMLVEMEAYAFNYYAGWYPRLFYREYHEVHGDSFSGDLFREDLVVADVHTQPTDEFGNPVGKVLHVGTGPVNMAVIVATLPGGVETTFTGPVMSYYEHVSLNFKRLTDEEWETTYDQSPSFRPEFVNPYLLDRQGIAIPGGLLLATDIEETPEIPGAAGAPLLASNYPNPFGESTLLRFRIPSERGFEHATLTVYNMNGQVVRRLADEPLGPGSYSARWDGVTDSGDPAPSGIYAVILEIGDRREQRLVTRVR